MRKIDWIFLSLISITIILVIFFSITGDIFSKPIDTTILIISVDLFVQNSGKIVWYVDYIKNDVQYTPQLPNELFVLKYLHWLNGQGTIIWLKDIEVKENIYD